MNLTNKQINLFQLIGNKELCVGKISQLYFNKYGKIKKTEPFQVMKRNSSMASWLTKLEDKGLISSNYYNNKYSLTSLTLKNLNNENGKNNKL